jgi:uncharacterized membrane protein YeaQ/YmgE (transglycosylase-associated protein family)
MGCLVVLLLLVILLGAGSFLAIGLTVGLILTLVVAGLVGWAADLVVPGHLPGGWLGSVLAGLVGGLIGTWLFRVLNIHDPAFTLFRIDLIPAFVGAVIICVALQLFSTRRPLT